MKRLFPGWILVLLTGCIPEDNVDNVVDPAVIPKGRPAAQSPRDKQTLSAANLNESSWNIVRSPKAPSERYQQALSWAQQACELNRRNANLLNTLGVAQYRVGDYHAAQKTLQQAIALRPDSDSNKDSAWDQVFLAMTWQQLGSSKQAQRALERVRDLIRLNELERNRELQAFMREAQRLIPPRNQPSSNSGETCQARSEQHVRSTVFNFRRPCCFQTAMIKKLSATNQRFYRGPDAVIVRSELVSHFVNERFVRQLYGSS